MLGVGRGALNEVLYTSLVDFFKSDLCVEKDQSSSLFEIGNMGVNELRQIGDYLVEMGLISIDQYFSSLNMLVNFVLTLDESDRLVSFTGEDVSSVLDYYSLAKHGGYNEICWFSNRITSNFINEMEFTGSSLNTMFEKAKVNNEHVVLLVPGSRNIESASNLMFDLALPDINIYLAKKGLPTIANVKIPRLDPPCENYASLSLSEREEISKNQDHILPGYKFYQNKSVNVIFGDDVFITGATADKVYFDAMKKGAVSFHSIYAVFIDQKVVACDPAVEGRLNTSMIKGELCIGAHHIFSQPDLLPVIKSFSLLLSKSNNSFLFDFLKKIPIENVVKIYRSGMSNGYINDNNFREAMLILERYVSNNE